MDLINTHIPLEKEESNFRKTLLKEIKYILFLNLSKINLNHYEGIVKIQFDLKEASNLHLDYEGIIKYIIVNDKNVSSERNLNRIFLRKEYLKTGYNNIEIKFNSSVKAKIKGGFKIFSNSDKINNEPFSTHEIFPCFDQPNLKCEINLFIYGNKDITFISNTEIDRNFKIDSQNLFEFQVEPNSRLLKFQEVKEISTHQFILLGGNFYIMNDPLNDNTKSQNTQLNLYFKKSQEIDNNPFETFYDIFSLIREGMSWFEKKLEFPFPYKKIDVVFVPEYKNVANSFPEAVIFVDVKFIEEKCDKLDREYFNFLILNQISQMWFFHLFSINWWEDSFLFDGLNILTAHLFFKEKYANSISNEKSFDLIFDYFKTKAIVADKSSDSHMVWLDINDTNDAKVLYDEITCYKGASLFYYLYSLYKCKFWEGLRRLLKSNENREKFLTSEEFFKEFEKIEVGREINSNLDEFNINQFKYFLKNEKLSRLRCIPQTEGNFDVLAIVQETTNMVNSTPSEKSIETYYPFVLDILFIYKDRQEIIERIIIHPKKINLIKLPKKYSYPLAIILNYQDEAHMIQKIDLESIKFFIDNPESLLNNTTKLLIIRDLYEMVKDGDLEPLFFIKFCHSLLNNERNIYIANRIISNAISVIYNYLTPYTFKSQKEEMFKLLSEKYFKNPHFENLKRNLINYILDVIDTTNLDNLKFLISSNLGMSIEEVQEDSEINEVREYDLKFLDRKTKSRIISAIYQNEKMTSIEKENLKKIILDQDNRISNNKYEEIMWNTLAYGKNEKEIREGLWKFIVYNEKDLSDEELKFYIKGFNKQSKLFEPEIQKYYRKKFFSDFPFVFTEHSLESSYRFYKYLNPCFLTREKVLKKMVKMKSKLKFTEENNKLRLLIESDIEELKKKLLLEKIYSHLKLYTKKNRLGILY